MMKKHLILVAFATLLATFFCSCEKENGSDNPDNTPVTARFEFGGSVGQQLSSIYHVTATYTLVSDDETRSFTQLAVGDGIVLDQIPCPCTLSLSMQYTPCGTVDTLDTYDFHLETYLNVTAADHHYLSSPNSDHQDVAGSHLQDLIDLENSVLPTYSISIDAQGNITAN